MEDRRSAAVGLSDWATANLRWDVTARVDRWVGRPGGARHRRRARAPRSASTAAIRLQGDVWPAGGFGVASLGARWRWSATASTGCSPPRRRPSPAATPRARCGAAPAPVTPGPCSCAPTRCSTTASIVGDAFGRRLLHASVEWRHGLAVARSADAAAGGVCRRGHRIAAAIGHAIGASGCRRRPASPRAWRRHAARLTTRAGSTMAGRPCRSDGNCRGPRGRDTTLACRRRLPLLLLTPDGPDTLAGSRPSFSPRCGSASATTACAPSSSCT